MRSFSTRTAATVAFTLLAGGVTVGTLSTGSIAQAAPAPGTVGLQPDLAAAYSQAWSEATAEGVPLHITSGKRSWAEQNQLWQQGLAKYGSVAAARRWVLPPNESTHVTGHAIDVGPQAGAEWLKAHGTEWGLCQAYANEWWHFELLTSPGGTCPTPLPDAADR
jgi:D-alanyl-D-alanine carboxypeptidase